MKPDVKPDTGETAEVKPDVPPDVPAEKPDATDAEVKPDVSEAGDAEVKPDVSETGDAEVKPDTEVGTDADASETTPPVCPVTPVCTLGAKMCGTGGVQTCVTVSGCPGWSAAVACAAHNECTGAGNCTCIAAPTGCTAAGTFCGSDGKLNTCVKDGACFFVSATVTCDAHTSCKGTPAACSCDNTNCSAAGATCANNKTVRACADDGSANHCLVAAETACGAIKVCAGGACACPAATGTHENEGCNRTTAVDICDANHVLTCVRDTDSGCDIWKVAPSGLCETDNGGGLTCGTKSGVAACQCPARAGTDVYVGEGGSDAANGVFPTGILSPAACRYRSLTKALSTTGATRVIATSVAPIAFAGESYPLTVPAGVALTTSEATPAPANYTISFDSNSAVQGLVLSAGSSIKGFTLSNASTNTVAPGISCSTDTAVIDTVVVDGNDGLQGGGIAVGTSCALVATNVTVMDINGVGVNVQSSGGAAINGGAISGSNVGIHAVSGTVKTNGLALTGNDVGILLDGLTPGIELTNGTVNSNGEGAVISKGSLIAVGTDVSMNQSNGIRSTAAGTSVALTTVTVGKNGGNGISVTSGAAALHGVTISTNTLNGVSSAGAGANVTIDQASVISGNTLNGVSATNGQLAITNAEIVSNTQNGLFLGGATADVSNVNIHLNKFNGVDISSNGVVINIGVAGPRNTLIGGNTLNGILVEKSSRTTPSESASLKIESAVISNNVASGVSFKGNAGEVFAILRSSVISSNGGTGVIVESGAGANTNTVFQDNDVTANGISGVTTGVGGILFTNSSTLSTFLGNKVHLNVGDEIGFFAIQALDPPRTTTTVWKISAAGCDAASNPNFIYAHGAGNVGLRAPVGVTIDAENVHWEVAPPSNIDDYSNTGGIDVTPNCSAAP